MGISKRVALWLVSQGHNAVHLNDEDLFLLPDGLILEKAVKEQRIILTADMDFGHLLAFNGSQDAAIIQFRVSNFKASYIIGNYYSAVLLTN
jgi:predicted nuclease of predicted toxin-antitoxin system